MHPLKLALLLALCPLSGLAQSVVTPATGDSRTVTEPTYPTVCATLQANKYIALTNLFNIDPYNPTASPQGKLGATGGTSYEPSANAPNKTPPTLPTNFVTDETKDNSALTSAMSSTACAGKAVELTKGTSGQNAFVFGQINVPAGVSIIGDAGIRIFGSRSPADYGGGSCGTISTSGSTSCQPWVNLTGAGSGIYGPAIWDGRGWDTFTTGATTQSFYYQRVYTYCIAHGGSTINGSPTCPSSLPTCTAKSGASGCKSNGPNAFQSKSASNIIGYDFTIQNSAQFNFNVETTNGCTFWGVKAMAPFEISNTDGWDPLNTTNCTFTHGNISTGDNITALKSTSTSTPTKNISFVNNQTGAGIGVAFGTDVEGGISNYLASGLQMNGNLYNSAQADGLSATDGSHTGVISQITYQNVCMQNEAQSWAFDIGNSSLSGLLLQNIAVLPSTYSGFTGQSGSFEIKGNSGNTITVQMDNVQFTGTYEGGGQEYYAAYLGPGTVQPTLVSHLTGTGVTVANHVSTSPAAYCTTSGWKPLLATLYIQTTTSNLNKTVTSAGPITLLATVQPATAINIKESYQPTGTVQFYDNGAPVGSPVALTGDNTLASLVVSSVPSGTNVYTVSYVPGASDHYAAETFLASVTATNGTPSTGITLTKGGTINVGGNLTAQ